MYILGISCYYHDSSATLLKDGIVVAATEEERFTRKKHDSSFPINAIKYCLKSQNITINEIDHIGFYEKPFLKFERILYQHLEMFPLSLRKFLSSVPSWINQKLRVMNTIRKELKYKKDVFFINHHMSHAASSFLVSPFKKAAILTIDGVGEWSTTTYGIGNSIENNIDNSIDNSINNSIDNGIDNSINNGIDNGIDYSIDNSMKNNIGNKNDINLMKEIKFPHSIGLLYSTITAYLGFSVNNSEYKVMGLAAYGNQNREKNLYYNKLLKTIDIKEDGSFRLDLNYFKFHYSNKMPSKKLCKLLGGKISRRNIEMTQRHKDIAAGLQLLTKDIIIKILNHLYKETKCDNLVLAGGVALNSVINGKILKNTPFKKIWIQPNASDAGTSLGVASYIYHTILGNKRNYIMKNVNLGPKFSETQIKNFLEQNKIKYTQFKNNQDLITTTAKLLYENSVVGWFQSGMEWGPRALGFRSILANPCNPNAKELLNLKVKHREKFRPFAPVVCEDDALKYFDCDNPIPETTDFMLMVYPVLKKWQKQIPSVTHIDESARLETIRKKQNHLYYDLIKKFGKLSKIPILINTSFNIRGEPIVCSPFDAYKCMMGTEIDYLVMENFLIKRNDNIQDIWESENNAKDKKQKKYQKQIENKTKK